MYAQSICNENATSNGVICSCPKEAKIMSKDFEKLHNSANSDLYYTVSFATTQLSLTWAGWEGTIPTLDCNYKTSALPTDMCM